MRPRSKRVVIWYRNFEYEIEGANAGLTLREDLFQQCVLRFNFMSDVATVIASTEPQNRGRC